MPADHDLISQPAKGRYFPLSHARVLKLVRDAQFQHTEYVKRIRVNFVNLDDENPQQQIVAYFWPKRYLTVSSFAEAVPETLAVFCVRTAIEQFRNYDRTFHPAKQSSRSTIHHNAANYCEVYLQDQEKLLVIERIAHRSTGKYRGTAKFSHAFKSTWQVMKETVLQEIAC